MNRHSRTFILKVILIAVWMLGVSTIMASLTSSHTMSFFPDISLIKTRAGTGTWTMTHVLGPGCKCSREVFRYLIQRGPEKEISEQVILLGAMPDEEKALIDRGFSVHQKSPRDIASEKAVGVPFLLITSPKGDALYSGGYSDHTIREGTPLHDLQILASLKDGKTASEFPIFGCAVSQRIQKLIDPLSLKYKESAL